MIVDNDASFEVPLVLQSLQNGRSHLKKTLWLD